MPFTVITLKKSSPSLRGDLTKWMQEIATGVYIGNFNSRVREKLWERVTATVGDGEATMSFACRNEIGYQFVTWNTERENIDYEGIPLVLLPIVEEAFQKGTTSYSDAAKFRNARKFTGVKPVGELKGKLNEKITVDTISEHDENITADSVSATSLPCYVVIDIETDGLDENICNIIELGAVRVVGEKKVEFNRLILGDKKLADDIVELTAITDSMLREKGVAIKIALEEFVDFIADDMLVGYNVDFDIRFINRVLESVGYQKLKNESYDLMRFVKREKMFLKDYKLETVLKAYGILEAVPHRALGDAKLIADLSIKVNKFQDLFRKK